MTQPFASEQVASFNLPIMLSKLAVRGQIASEHFGHYALWRQIGIEESYALLCGLLHSPETFLAAARRLGNNGGLAVPAN